MAGQTLADTLAARHGGPAVRWLAWLRQNGLPPQWAEAQLTAMQRAKLQQLLASQRPVFAGHRAAPAQPTSQLSALQWTRAAIGRYVQAHQPWALAQADAAEGLRRDHAERFLTMGDEIGSAALPLPEHDPLVRLLLTQGVSGAALRLWVLLEVAARYHPCSLALAGLAWTGVPRALPLRMALAIAAPGTVGRPLLPPALELLPSPRGDLVRLRGPAQLLVPVAPSPQTVAAQVAGLLQRLPPLPPDRIPLVLASSALAALRDLHLRWQYREVVQQSGGSGGVIALFAGQTGHGRRTAARQVAQEIGLDVCRVQAALLGSRWIGESEARISQMFAQAAHAGAALLVEDANDMMTKHVSTTTANDRYANSVRNHLLQEIEQFPGLVLLIAGGPHQFDGAMQRRIHVTVRMDAPNRRRRGEIMAAAWQWLIAQAPALQPEQVPDFWTLVAQEASPQQLVHAVIEAGLRAHRYRAVVDDDALEAVLAKRALVAG